MDAEDREELQTLFSNAAARLLDQLPAEPTRPFDRPINSFNHTDFSPLVTERRRHETPRAARCVRVGKKAGTHTGTESESNPSDDRDAAAAAGSKARPGGRSSRREILQAMHALLRQHEEKRVGTGLSRQERWTGKSGANTSTSGLSGNSANAVLAAGQRASAVCLSLLT